MALGLDSTARMNDGREIPRLGLGVFRAPSGGQARDAVLAALELGYRHIDTAAIYGNERDVGVAMRASRLERREIFVTTKLWNADQGYESAKRALARSLEQLGLDYVDLYLLHWPVPGKRLESWKALVELRREGKCRSIGVSNFMVRHLEELAAASPVVPAVNQVELSPFLGQEKLRAYCAQRGIVVEAYSPLTKGRRLGHPLLGEIGREHGKSPAQVLIRWALQRDTVVIPKSVRRERIAENAAVFDFELSADELRRLDALEENLHTGWDPSDER